MLGNCGVGHVKNNENCFKGRSSGPGLLTAIVVSESHFVAVVPIVAVLCEVLSLSLSLYIYIYIKFNLQQATKTQRGSSVVALLFL